ncbi:hypothetical protein BKA66DRAFT_425319, partial [Pyrenochaeta sp. MPI-SDFR-AT-0127]
GANTCGTDKHRFKNIEHSDRSGHVERTKWVEVFIASDFIPKSYGTHLQAAFIKQIADTFMIAGTDDKNCYKFDRKSSIFLLCNEELCIPPTNRGDLPDRRGRLIKWCNAPEYVRVSVYDDNGKEVAHMRVNLNFQGVTDQGMFDCVGVIDAVDKNARDGGIDRLKELTGGKEFETLVGRSSTEVTGNCLNEKCLYQLGNCFK